MSTSGNPFGAAQAMAAFNQMNASNPFNIQGQQFLSQGLTKEQANQQSAQAFAAAVQAANPHLDFSKRDLNNRTGMVDPYQQAEEYYRRYGTGMPQIPSGSLGIDPATGQISFNDPVSRPIAAQQIGDGGRSNEKPPVLGAASTAPSAAMPNFAQLFTADPTYKNFMGLNRQFNELTNAFGRGNSPFGLQDIHGAASAFQQAVQPYAQQFQEQGNQEILAQRAAAQQQQQQQLRSQMQNSLGPGAVIQGNVTAPVNPFQQQAASIPLNQSPLTSAASTAASTAPTGFMFGTSNTRQQFLSPQPMNNLMFGPGGTMVQPTQVNSAIQRPGGQGSGGMALEGKYGVSAGNSSPFPIQGQINLVRMAQGGPVATSRFNEEQLREAGEFIRSNLSNPALIAEKAAAFNVTVPDILAAANAVNEPVAAAQVTEYFRPTSYQPSAGWSQQQLADAGNFIAQNIDNPAAIEAARANVEQATGLNISSADLLAAAGAAQKPAELSRAMADVISGDVYGNMNVKGAYDWINRAIIGKPQLSAQSAQQVMRDLGISGRDVAQAALLDPRISAGAQYALVSNPLYQQGQLSGLAALNANINNFITNALQYQTPTQARQSLQNALQSGVLTAGRALNEYDVQRATGKSLNDLFKTAVQGPQVLGPLKALPDLTGSYVPPTAPPPEAPPPALTPGQEGLKPGTAIVGNIPTSAQVRIPQLDAEFRASAPRTAVYDRLGRVSGYEYTPAAKLAPATGTTVFNWTPPGVTSRPRQLLSKQDVPGATFDPVTGEAQMPLSASQRFARDRAQLDRDFRQMYAAQAAQDSSLPAQAPASAAQAFRELALSDPETAMQLKLRDIEQQRFDPAKADMAVRARYGAQPAQAAVSSLFAPFINRNMATLQGLAKLQNPVTYAQRRPDVAEAYAKLSAEDKRKFPTLLDYEVFHYNTFGKNEDPTLPNPLEQLGKLQSPYATTFFSKGGEASTEDFIKKQSGGDVSRETASPETRKTRLPSGVQRAVSKAQESRTVVPVPGIGEARQFMSGFIGVQPDYSVMDPNYKALGSAYRTGEQASVAADVFGALTPFATASALSKASQIPGIAELIAYHGSPHRFKKFDASKIGTGEGAQSYGHGLYFAENPKVAKGYRDALSKQVRGDTETYEFNGQPISLNEFIFNAKSRHPNLSENQARDAAFFATEFNEKRRDPFPANSEVWSTPFGKAVAFDMQGLKKIGGSLYTVDIPDEKIAQMLDWDKPLSQQPKAFQDVVSSLPRFQDPYVASKTTGGEAYGELAGKLGGRDKAAESLRQAGIPGIKYLDQVSRNKPLKDIKREFLNELPENASIDEVVELLGTGTFSPKNEAIIKELAANDWLGFDYPAQSLSTVLSPSARNYDLSPSLMRAINEAQEGGTRNFVLFPGEEQNIKMLDINGEPLEKQDGGEVTTEEFIKKNVSRETSSPETRKTRKPLLRELPEAKMRVK